MQMKQVTSQECVEWQKANPMKEAIAKSDRSIDIKVRLRWNPKREQHEMYDIHWSKDDYPHMAGYTYFIPVETDATMRTFICPFCEISNAYNDEGNVLNRCEHNTQVVRYGDDNLVEYVVFRSAETIIKAEELK